MYLFPFTPWLFIAVIMLMYLLPVFAYLISGRPKKTFGLVPAIFFAILLFALTTIGQINFTMFWPSFPAQIFLSIVVSWLFIPFVFQFPSSEGVGKEARIIFWGAALIPIYALILLIINITHFLQPPHALIPMPFHFWLLGPALMLITSLISIRRFQYFKRQNRREKTHASKKNLDAMKRLFATAFLLSIGMGLWMFNAAFSGDFIKWVELFIPLMILVSMAIGSFVILEFMDDRDTLTVRLMGLVLVGILAVFGAVGLNMLDMEEQIYTDIQREDSTIALQIYQSDEIMAYPNNLVYIATFSAAGNEDEAQIELVYRSQAGADLSVTSPELFSKERWNFASAFAITDELWKHRVVRDTLFVGRGYVGYQFNEGDKVVEFGFPIPWQNEISHLLMSRLIAWVVISTLIILLIFPIMFRRILVNPLNELLAGVEQVNDGDLQTVVAVNQNDEIGYLTTSFNGMTASLLALNEGLEETVAQRTADLQQEIIEREKAERKATDANQAKSTFLANMSHDLRTPLNAILGYAQIIQTNSTNAEQNAEIIQRSGKHLLALIDDILDLSKVESGRFSLREQEVSLRLFLQRIFDMTKAEADAKGLSFELKTNVPDAVSVMVDPTRLRQVLVNLIDNAIHYTETGSVTIFVEQLLPDQFDGMTQVYFAVEDSGIGIASKDLANIYQPYYQVSHAVSKGGKSGLGLTISNELVRAMGGLLDVDSEQGKGSKFSFSLDLYMGTGISAVNPKQRTTLVGPAPRIFIIDDNAENIKVLNDMLLSAGITATCYEEAWVALADAIHVAPDAIITDIFMPDFDGYQFISALRKQPETTDIPVIAASASVFPDDEKRSREAGADFFLPKPLEMTTLLDVLTEALALEWQSEVSQTEADDEPFVLPPLNVMQILTLHAQEGDLGSLQQRVKVLTEAGEYRPFIAKVQPFLSALDMKELQTWLETTIVEKELSKR